MRDDPGVEFVAFTATEIPGISGRGYPPALAGSRYPGGIPIVPETLRGGVERYASTRDVLAAAEETGDVNVRAADILVVNKVNAASRENDDPRPGARGSIADAFVRFPHLGTVLPALGYGETQLACTDRAREAGRHSSLNGAGAPAGGQVDALKPPRARPPIRR